MTALPSAEATGALASTENGRRIKELIIRTNFFFWGGLRDQVRDQLVARPPLRLSAGHWGVFGRLPAPR